MPLLRIRAKNGWNKISVPEKRNLSLFPSINPPGQSLLFCKGENHHLPKCAPTSHRNSLRGHPRPRYVPALCASKTTRSHRSWILSEQCSKVFPSCYCSVNFCLVPSAGRFCFPVLYHIPGASLWRLTPPCLSSDISLQIHNSALSTS